MGASISLEIQRLEKSKPFKTNDAPFNDIYIVRSEDEIQFMKDHFSKRTPILARDIGNELLIHHNNDIDAKIKGKTKSLADQIIKQELLKLLEFNSDSQITDSLGFYEIKSCEKLYFNLDGIIGLEIENPLVVALLAEHENGDELTLKLLNVFCSPDMDSDISYITFQNTGDIAIDFSEIEHTDKLYLILYEAEVSDILSLSQIGLSIIPLMFEEGDVFMHGQFQLPIYNEMLTLASVSHLSSLSPWSVLSLLPPPTSTGTLSIRLYPSQLSCAYRSPSPSSPYLTSTMFLPLSFPSPSLHRREPVQGGKTIAQGWEGVDSEEIRNAVEQHTKNVYEENLDSGARQDDDEGSEEDDNESN